MSVTTTTAVERRTDLDSLRILMVVGLVFFHSALVFDTRDDFYVRNAETTDITVVLAAGGVLWAMPMLFFVAGLGARHSLRRRGTAGFVAERLRRLGVPLVFATAAIVPIPQWLRLRSDPAQQVSYLEFLPRFFDVHLKLSDFPFILEGEFFETGHLWFLVLLLTFCLILAALTHGLRAVSPPEGGPAWPERLGGSAAAYALAQRGSGLLPALPLGLLCALAGLEREYAGWNRWAYLIFFLLGFVFSTDARFRAALRRDTRSAVVAGVLLFLAGAPLILAAGDGAFTELTPLAMTGRLLYGAAGWCWLAAILGLLDRPRPSRPLPAGEPSRWRVYLGEAVLPLYVLHQPIVVAVAYLVVGWDSPVIVKYVAIVVISLAVIAAVYHVVVRRTRATRFLFGMRPKP